MEFVQDKFNGIIIESGSVSDCSNTFHTSLVEIITFAQNTEKNLIWLTLPIHQSHLIEPCTREGFKFHNCLETEITLVYKNVSNVFVPFIPTHTLGAGALIVNSSHEVLLVKEHGMNGYKLPGGHIDLGEPIESAIQREVLEETGIESDFESIVGITTKHPYRFGKSNMYIICRLKAVTDIISIQDKNEIEDARWTPISDYLQDTNNSLFNRQMVEKLSNEQGLRRVQLEGDRGPHKKQEVFFSNSKN
ncbi:NUDIX hydrolase [Endozoicomonas arenosclerae]|uniref:NUDIX hydrolase n=1 Tax=Endozoicomonas arenosclerae TaxID=1633495 RepID=UPI000784C380|nr:NUDIX domain-containing protein [Endozoicomonas arenosclerae]